MQEGVVGGFSFAEGDRVEGACVEPVDEEFECGGVDVGDGD